MERFITLNMVGTKVSRQSSNPGVADESNPLGRVLQVYHANKDIDSETLQLKLDEAILKEQPAINARIAFIKIISMVALLAWSARHCYRNDRDFSGDHSFWYW